MTIRQAVQYGIKKLSQNSEQDAKSCSENSTIIFSPSPALDTNCILEYLLKKNRTYLMVHCDDELSENDLSLFENAINKRLTGLPIAYITGQKEFYGLDFFVTPDVLIPKPDTELLVEHAISISESFLKNKKNDNPYKIADICTGSGCIAISVLHNLQEIFKLSTGNSQFIEMYASDISTKALEIAKKNVKNLLQANDIIKFSTGDLLQAFSDKQKFNLILSNPPYIPAKEVTELLKDGRSEPRLALDGDTDSAVNNDPLQSDDGLAIIKRLIPQAFNALLPNGIFLIETGEYNAKKTATLMEKCGFSNVQTFTDLAGQLRLTQGQKN